MLSKYWDQARTTLLCVWVGCIIASVIAAVQTVFRIVSGLTVLSPGFGLISKVTHSCRQ